MRTVCCYHFQKLSAVSLASVQFFPGGWPQVRFGFQCPGQNGVGVHVGAPGITPSCPEALALALVVRPCVEAHLRSWEPTPASRTTFPSSVNALPCKKVRVGARTLDGRPNGCIAHKSS